MGKIYLTKKRSKSEYVDLTRQALNELFRSEESIYRVAQISEMVAKKKGTGYTKAGVQSSVSRALAELVEFNEILQVEQGYVPNDIDAIRHILRDRMVSDIEYSRGDIFTLSKKMMLIGVAPSSMDVAKRYFREYLGEKNCFDILEYGGYMVLLMVWFKKKDESSEDAAENVKKILQDIQDIVSEGFHKEDPQKRSKRKPAQPTSQETEAHDASPKENEAQSNN